MNDAGNGRQVRRMNARRKEQVEAALRWLDDAFWQTDIDPKKKRQMRRRINRAKRPKAEAKRCYSEVKDNLTYRYSETPPKNISVANLDRSAAQEVRAGRSRQGWSVDEGQLRQLESALVRGVINQHHFNEICRRLVERR